MGHESTLLLLTAASLAFFHTLFGPDHYLPFIAISRARQWKLSKTAFIVVLCGLAHIFSSVVIGSIGIAFGISLSEIEIFESFRGNLTAWLLIVFGILYTIYGIRKVYKKKKHIHFHHHHDGTAHLHEHDHQSDHLHVHEGKTKNKITPWVLFIIFLFGPCEPLIPILMYPAAQSNTLLLLLVILIFGLITILTMLILVLLPLYGIEFIRFNKFEKYTHAIAGFTILLCGISIQFLGL
jgi:nickel/cobalt transporter (NicO) family protein